MDYILESFHRWEKGWFLSLVLEKLNFSFLNIKQNISFLPNMRQIVSVLIIVFLCFARKCIISACKGIMIWNRSQSYSLRICRIPDTLREETPAFVVCWVWVHMPALLLTFWNGNCSYLWTSVPSFVK